MLSAFYHTNRPLRNATDPSFRVHAGWWASSHDMNAERRRFAKSEFPYHAKFALHQARKYEWMLAAAARIRSSSSGSSSSSSSSSSSIAEPWLLSDTDTVIQCSARELRERWEALGSPPLLVGAETKWFPRRDYSHNPWPPTGSPMRYPNSGLLLGSAAGFGALAAAFAAMPRYPCCPTYTSGKATGKCHIDDQHCLLTALQQRPRPAGFVGGWPAPLSPRVPEVPFLLDSNATVFLNLHGVTDEQLVKSVDGRCAYSATGRVPCVLHANGKAAKPRMRAVMECAPKDAWVVPAGDPWEGIAKPVR